MVTGINGRKFADCRGHGADNSLNSCEYLTKYSLIKPRSIDIRMRAQLDISAPSVWLIRLSEVDLGCINDLTAHEQMQARTHGSVTRQREYSIGRALLRRVLRASAYAHLADHELAYGEHAKPILPNTPEVHFNISHAADCLVLAVQLHTSIGIDIESRQRTIPSARLAQRFCHAAELEWLSELPAEQRERGFLELWVRKEALLKARGDGVHGGPARVDAATGVGGTSSTDAQSHSGIGFYHGAPSADERACTTPFATPAPQRWQLTRVPAPKGYTAWLATAPAAPAARFYDGLALMQMSA
jgi:4'-phosphopantetheinyl transferase